MRKLSTTTFFIWISVGIAFPSSVKAQENPINIRQLNQSCYNNNDVKSCNNLGVYYETGENVSINRDIAISLYNKACKLGSNNACLNASDLKAKMDIIDNSEKKFTDLTMSIRMDMISLHERRCFVENDWRKYVQLIDIFVNGQMVFAKASLRNNSDFGPIAKRAVDGANLASTMADGASQRQTATGSCVPR